MDPERSGDTKPQITAEQSEFVAHLINEALRQPTEQRVTYLAAIAGVDEAVRSLVMSIFEHDGFRTRDLPESPPRPQGDAFEPTVHAKLSITPFESGMTLGPYTLREQLGRGGFGEVWRADRCDPNMTVAIKVIRPDRTDPTNLARFAAESQALALLDHPNIAKIHDAGVNDDLVPYLVMEYVQGVPLSDYCDRERLTITQRLELMAKICDAVHHAHTQGLIHRDLSPDNILVTIHEQQTPEPKIVDFGIAKSLNKHFRLTDQTLTQDLNTLIGKPAYMAPEQAEAKQIGVDTRTDIFSLGVILYEMLTGVLPIGPEQLREQAIDAVLAMLRGKRPDPTTRILSLSDEQSRSAAEHRRLAHSDELRRLLSGRVQHLPMKALRVDRTKRFSSAAAMALDIRNYLEGKDFIEAVAEPWRDRALRHVKRHNLFYAAAAMVMTVLVGGGVGTTWGFRNAEIAKAAEVRERAHAETEAARRIGVMSGQTDFLKHLDVWLRQFENTPEVRVRVLSESLQLLLQMEDEFGSHDEWLRNVAWHEEMLGDVLCNPDVPSLGRIDEGLKSYQQSLRRLISIYNRTRARCAGEDLFLAMLNYASVTSRLAGQLAPTDARIPGLWQVSYCAYRFCLNAIDYADVMGLHSAQKIILRGLSDCAGALDLPAATAVERGSGDALDCEAIFAQL